MTDPLWEFRGNSASSDGYKARQKNGKWLCLRCRKHKAKSEFGMQEKKSTGKRTVRADCNECCRKRQEKRYVPRTPRIDPRRLLPSVGALETRRDAE